jgi:trigger factor
METTLKKLNKQEHELTVKVSGEELKEYIAQAEESIGKETEIKGFRKGKVPKDLIKKKVGDSYILQVALDIALKDTLAKAIEKDKLDVLKTVKLDVEENTKDGLLYKVNLTLFPEIKIGDLEGLSVDRKAVSVNDEEINAAIEVVRSSRASFSQKDGPAEKGDRVEVDFEVMLDGKAIDGGISKNHPLVIGEGNFIPGFEDNILGAQKGDNRDFSLVAPKDYARKELANKKLDFKLKVNTVQRVIKPELNEDFIKSLGRFDSLDNLKDNVRSGIEQDKKIKESQRVRLDILEKISEKSQAQLPDEIVEEKLDNMISNFDHDLHRKGMELSLYLAHINKTQDSLRKDWKSEAEKQVKFSIIIRKLARDKGVIVASEELDQAVAQRVQAMMTSGQVDKDSINLEALRDGVYNELITEKTLVFLEQTYSA